MMLRVDVEPIITPSQPCNSFGGEKANGDHPFAGDDGTCSINSAGNSVAQNFAGDINAFFTQFALAWQGLTEFGYAEGQLVDVGQPPFDWPKSSSKSTKKNAAESDAESEAGADVAEQDDDDDDDDDASDDDDDEDDDDDDGQQRLRRA